MPTFGQDPETYDGPKLMGNIHMGSVADSVVITDVKIPFLSILAIIFKGSVALFLVSLFLYGAMAIFGLGTLGMMGVLL